MSNRLQELLSNRPLIAPSMLKCDFGNLHREFALLEQAEYPLLHLDVMDGNFVPNLSYGPMVIERMRELTTLPFDAHLMISDPAKYLDDYLSAGCDAITFHIEAVPEPTELLGRIRENNCLAGLAINPGTSVESIEKFIPLCDLVLVMSVEPGFGGQEFKPSALDKLRHIKGLLRDDQLLSVDGGVAIPTIGACAEAGADTFVCGSSIFNELDYSEAHSGLKAAIETVNR
ncbi:MAG: ribulose-phosphate 3-epimerase [Planctomycetaceae bacterium]|nr:ribulose-phosphate 3-epimerase [Planctomycetaceae bacterium]